MNNSIKIHLSFFVFMLPVVHVMANVTTNYFDPGTFNPGFIRTIYITVVILLAFYKFNIPEKSLFLIAIVFLTYNLVLVFLNEEFLTPLINFFRLSLPILLFFVGYSVINNQERLDKLFKYYLLALALFLVNIVIVNIMGIGESQYVDDTFYMGGARVGSANELSVFILIALTFILINDQKRWNWFSILLIAGSTIIILVSMRRGAYLTLAGGMIIFTYLIGFTSKKILRYLVFAGIILVALYPIYSTPLIERYEHRKITREGSLANIEIEGRFQEMEDVPVSLTAGGVSKWLTGTHNLNSEKYWKGREIHVGYLAILHGSGLIGLGLFLLLIYTLFNKGWRVYKRTKNSKYHKIHLALYFSLIISLLLYLVTSRMHGFNLVAPVFLMMGSIMGTITKNINSR